MNTGFVYAGAYAKKVRRIGFAISKAEGISAEQILAEVANLNQLIFDKLAKAGVDKVDVIRIEVPYETNGGFKFKTDELKIEVFKKEKEIV